jgi:REP element-mobilizing transposase RayT
MTQTEMNICFYAVGPVPRTGRKDALPKRKQTHLESFDYADSNTVFFITLCAYDKRPYFDREDIANAVIEEIDFRMTCLNEVAVFTYCVMPDHIHLLLKLKKEYGKTLQNWVAAFKRYTARQVGVEFNVSPL